MNELSDVFVLRNGSGIPCIGFGTFELPPGATTVSAVKNALEEGYRLIDTAMIYRNETNVARALRESKVPRDQVFLATKLWNADRGYDSALRACERSLRSLETDYLDLYLIHWPAKRTPDSDEWQHINNDTWRAFERLLNEGMVRAIGVSNFKPHHLEALKGNTAPMVNQIEFHPGFMQNDTVAYCHDHEIVVEAWSPLASGRLTRNALLQDVAQLYGKTVSQLVIRWCLQHDVLPLIRTLNSKHLRSNTQVFDFAISSEDMKRIDLMPYMAGSGLDPDSVDF